MKTKDIKSTEKKTSSLDKVKALKEKIIANANALADRILNKAIAKEEQQKAWETRKEELKAEAAKKRKEAALKKREEKAKKLIQIHASIPTKDTSKKQKAIDKEIEKKHDEKMIAMETKFEDFDPKRQKLTKEERIERNKKRAIKLIHHKEIFIIPAPRTTHKNLKSLILCISCRFQNLDIVKSCYQFVSSNSFFLTMQFHKTQWNPQDIFYDYEHVYTFDSNLTPVNQCCQIFFLTSYPPVSIGGF